MPDRRVPPTDCDLARARDEYASLLEIAGTKEREWQRFFAANPYVLARGLPLNLDPRDIQPRARPGVAEADFHIYPHKMLAGDCYGVIEIKRPDSSITTSPRTNIVILSTDAETAIAQAQRDAAQLQAQVRNREDHLLVIGNQLHLFVIMGMSRALRARFRDDLILSRIEETLPRGLQIIPYDTLYTRFERTVPAKLHFLSPATPLFLEEELRYRILIAETEFLTLQVLAELLSHEFPRAEILEATTIREGLEILDQAETSGTGINVLVQECRIPLERGGRLEFSWELCDAVRRRGSSARVIHISAFPDDIEVYMHMKDSHRNGSLIAKMNPQWPIELVQEINQAR
jgi:CheY-like chemotaxis protein